MAILPIDLQVQFAQLGNLGQILSKGENIALNQSMVAGEHVNNMSNKVDHSVTQTDETPGEGNKIQDGAENNSTYFGNEENKEKEREKEEKSKKEQNLDPYRGNIIDIRE